MKWILFIVLTMSHQNDGRTPIAVDHIEFKTREACAEMKIQIENRPAKSFVDSLNGPIIDARCIPVDDRAAE